MIKKNSTIQEEFDLSLFLFIAKRSLSWALVFFIIALISAYLFVRYSTEEYQTSAVIQINQENTASTILNVSNPLEPQEKIDSKIELLRSKVFLNRALAKLPLQISYYNKGTFKTYENYVSSGYVIEVYVKDDAVYGRPFFIDFISYSEVEISFLAPATGEKVTQNYKTNVWNKLPEVDFRVKIIDFKKVVSNKNIVNKVIQYFVINNPENISAVYSPNLHIKLLSADANTIRITVKDNNPRKCSDIANTIAAEFITYDVERKAQSSTKILGFIDKQLDAVYQQLSTTENKIQEFRLENKLSDPERFSQTYIKQMSDFEIETLNLNLDKAVIDEVAKALSRDKDPDVYHLLAILAGTPYANTFAYLIKPLEDLLSKRELTLYDATNSNNQIKIIDDQIEEKRKQLYNGIRTIQEKLDFKQQNLKYRIDESEKKFSSLPPKEVEYAR